MNVSSIVYRFNARYTKRYECIGCRVQIVCERSSDMNISIVVFRLSARDRAI
jgi:hypothetical protein